MANNRLYLVCTHCLHDPAAPLWRTDDHPGTVISFLKYYPTTGWYVNVADTDAAKVAWVDRTNLFFDQHRHGTLLGEFIIAYEGELDPDQRDKQEILIAVANKLNG